MLQFDASAIVAIGNEAQLNLRLQRRGHIASLLGLVGGSVWAGFKFALVLLSSFGLSIALVLAFIFGLWRVTDYASIERLPLANVDMAPEQTSMGTTESAVEASL